MLSTELLAFYRQVSQQLLTVVDVETTGHPPSAARVIEISVLQATLAEGIQHQQTHLVNPHVHVPVKITQFTGISQEMVDQAPEVAEVWQQYLPLLNCGVLTAHNLEFDYAFIQSELEQLGIAFSRPATEQLCTVMLARLMLSELPSRSLPNLVEHYGFAVSTSHRAEADTLACWLLAERLLTEIQNEADDTLLRRFAQQWIPLEQVAAILGCSSGKEARSYLAEAGIEPRAGGSRKNPTYQRGEVERLFLESPWERQLSWL